MQNSGGSGSLEFYKKRFEIENGLTSGQARISAARAVSFDRSNCLDDYPRAVRSSRHGHSGLATLFSIPIRAS